MSHAAPSVVATGWVPEIEDLSGRKLGEFVLRARIGEGGFGAVYRCEQPLLDQPRSALSPGTEFDEASSGLAEQAFARGIDSVLSCLPGGSMTDPIDQAPHCEFP